MNFKMVHENYNVGDLARSMDFYEKALGLTEVRRIAPPSGDFIIVYLGNKQSPFLLELTWLRDRKEPYNLGENEFHLAFQADDFEAAKKTGWADCREPQWDYYLDPDVGEVRKP